MILASEGGTPLWLTRQRRRFRGRRPNSCEIVSGSRLISSSTWDVDESEDAAGLPTVTSFGRLAAGISCACSRANILPLAGPLVGEVAARDEARLALSESALARPSRRWLSTSVKRRPVDCCSMVRPFGELLRVWRDELHDCVDCSIDETKVKGALRKPKKLSLANITWHQTIVTNKQK